MPPDPPSRHPILVHTVHTGTPLFKILDPPLDRGRQVDITCRVLHVHNAAAGLGCKMALVGA